jgi:hypothetical protein
LLRIVGIQKSEEANNEFVLLQNHSSMRIRLRGHVVMAESFIDSDFSRALHAFAEDELIHPGAYVLLKTCAGTPRWARTKEGCLVFYCFMNRSHSTWTESHGSMTVLSPQHCYEERPAPFAELV